MKNCPKCLNWNGEYKPYHDAYVPFCKNCNLYWLNNTNECKNFIHLINNHVLSIYFYGDSKTNDLVYCWLHDKSYLLKPLKPLICREYFSSLKDIVNNLDNISNELFDKLLFE